MTQVIAIANQKGGVGKTTTAINLAGALEEEGFRVLCIDMDPQANLTAGLGINLNTVERSMADVLADGRATLADVIRPTETAGIDVAPANIDLASTEGELFTALGREQAEQLGRLLSRLLGPQQRLIKVSPLGRALETATIIRQLFPGPEPIVDPRLQEMTLGTWEGLTRKEVDERCRGVVGGDSNAEWWFRAPGGESYAHFQERVNSWLAEQSGTVIAVSHGITTRMIRVWSRSVKQTRPLFARSAAPQW